MKTNVINVNFKRSHAYSTIVIYNANKPFSNFLSLIGNLAEKGMYDKNDNIISFGVRRRNVKKLYNTLVETGVSRHQLAIFEGDASEMDISTDIR